MDSASEKERMVKDKIDIFIDSIYKEHGIAITSVHIDWMEHKRGDKHDMYLFVNSLICTRL